MKVFITGISSDIGLEVCAEFLVNGWTVVGQYRTMRPELHKLSKKYNSRIKLMQFDFNDFTDLNIELLNKKYKFLDCNSFINCSAFMKPEKFEHITKENLLIHFNINVVPVFMFISQITKSMLIRKWGRIVILGSIGAKFSGGDSNFCYALSKHCLELIPASARIWAEKNVFINTLRVGVTNTRIHKFKKESNNKRIQLIPAKRMAEPKEIAKLVFYLGSEKNTYITNQILPITGGE
jgi:acetoacetyl-CoA reductase